MRPLSSKRLFENTGVATAALFADANPSRQNDFPVTGSRLLIDCIVQTMSCRRPPALMTIGEDWPAVSLRLLQISLPDFMSNATTHASGFPPTWRITRPPSTSGEALMVA